MYKRSHKKKKRRVRNHDGKDKENQEEKLDEQGPSEDEEEPCYEIRKTDEMGRYLVASRDIGSGEVIIKTSAIAVGPCAGCQIICLGCYKELDENNIPVCKKCKWPLCSNSCRGLGIHTGHSHYECDALKNAKPNYKDIADLKHSYHAIMPLRCLLLKTTNKTKWDLMMEMESHNALRKTRGDIWPLNQTNVVDRLRRWKMDYPEEDIHTICGILEVNAFEVGPSGENARALYPVAYLLAHSCVPTTTHTDDPSSEDRPIILRTSVAHKKGDLLTLCYAYTLQCTLIRREHIFLSKFFWCSCIRCSDKTEMSVQCGAIRCSMCGQCVLPEDPLSMDGAWKCVNNQCRHTIVGNTIKALLIRLTEEFENLDANDVLGFEEFLQKYRHILHDTHYLCLSAKHSLSQLYGKVTNHMINVMPTSELNRKIEICRDLMKVFDIIEPGYSRLRGVTLYELHAPLMILTTRDFEKKTISKNELRNRLKEIVGYLRESALILGFEPPNSSEGLMASAAREALSKIKTWESFIGKIS